VGKPNERERDLLVSFRKVHISRKTTFLAKENTSQHQICSIEIFLVFHAKIVLLSCLFCTSFSLPTVHCTDYSVRPKNNRRKSKNCLENHAENCCNFHAKSVWLYGLYGLYRIVRTVWIRTVRSPTIEKKNRSKIHRNFFSRIVPTFLEKCALFADHFPLSSILRKSL
jgi:hypothetical protein